MYHFPYPNIKHKDRFFVFLFGSEAHKEFTLSLYNAINDTSYDDPSLIRFNTLDNFLYMGIKNDVSFLIADTINFYEHQSTLNRNMSLRMLMYASRIYNVMIEDLGDSIYYDVPIKLPAPSFVVFYNGEKEIKDTYNLHLSDVLSNSNGIQLEMDVKVININYGHSEWLMEKCPPLKEYSWFIQQIRDKKRQTGDLSQAIADAIMKMPNDYVIKPIISKHTAEVFEMMFTIESYEKDMQKYFDTVKRYATKEGLEEGLERGLKEGREKGLQEGLKEGKKEGIKEGIKEGKKEGIKEGKIQAINESKIKAIELMMELGYPEDEARKMVEEKFK